MLIYTYFLLLLFIGFWKYMVANFENYRDFRYLSPQEQIIQQITSLQANFIQCLNLISKIYLQGFYLFKVIFNINFTIGKLVSRQLCIINKKCSFGKIILFLFQASRFSFYSLNHQWKLLHCNLNTHIYIGESIVKSNTLLLVAYWSHNEALNCP